MVGDYLDLGWQVLPQDKGVRRWVKAAHSAALSVTNDPEQRATWLRHGGTWFVGVDALPNDADGSIGGVPLSGPWEQQITLPRPLHRAQISTVYPGYPQQGPDDTDAAHRYRTTRDAAHLDGLLPVGPDKRRFLHEPHAFVLGLPLSHRTACPLVVWEGSHEVIRDAFLTAFAGCPPDQWRDLDVTEIYKEARAEVFDLCDRREVRAEPGQSILMHRLAIHGVAPWKPADKAPTEGRMIAYFRPVLADPRRWLRDD